MRHRVLPRAARARLVVVERGSVPGEQSRKNWGFVRQQGRDPIEVPLMMEANRIWHGLEAELGAGVVLTADGRAVDTEATKELRRRGQRL